MAKKSGARRSKGYPGTLRYASVPGNYRPAGLNGQKVRNAGGRRKIFGLF